MQLRMPNPFEDECGSRSGRIGIPVYIGYILWIFGRGECQEAYTALSCDPDIITSIEGIVSACGDLGLRRGLMILINSKLRLAKGAPRLE